MTPDSSAGRQPNVPVIFTSAEEAQKRTGKFSVFSLKISSRLARLILEYIRKEGLSTWNRDNKAKTSYNTYTLKFTVREYTSTDYAWISTGGRAGRLKSTLMRHYFQQSEEEKAANIRRPIPRETRSVERYNATLLKTPSLTELYFWIAKKYPTEVLVVNCSFDSADSFAGDANGRIEPDAVPQEERSTTHKYLTRNPVGDPYFDALDTWRVRVAAAATVPPYHILHDGVLRDIASSKPSTMEELGQLPGIGSRKLARFGDAILGVIREQAMSSEWAASD